MSYDPNSKSLLILYSNDIAGLKCFSSLLIGEQQTKKTDFIADPLPCDQETTDAFPKKEIDVENKFQDCVSVVALLTNGCLKNETFVKILSEAYHAKKDIVLIHDIDSFDFPHVSDLIDPLQSIFHKIAIPFLEEYASAVWNKIIDRLIVQQSNISTNFFLSHRQKTAQGIALALYHELTKKGYKVFLDIRADFEIHILERIVKQTDVFVLILSEGIYESKYCMEELSAATNSKIVVVKELNFNDPIKDPWKSIKSKLDEAQNITYSAYYANECAAKLEQSFLQAMEEKANEFHLPRKGLVCHLDASQQSTEPSFPLTWTDLSGVGNHAVAPDESKMPVLVDCVNRKKNFKAYRFDGADDGMDIGPISMDHLYTIFIVNRYSGAKTGRTLQSRDKNWLLGLWGGHHGHFAEGWVYRHPANRDWFICCAVKEDDEGSKYYCNSVEMGQYTSGKASPGRLGLVGQGLHGKENSNADISEIIIYDEPLSSTDKKRVEIYLSVKYGIRIA